MYEEYFGLERPPFKITPDTSLFYDGGKRGDILAALVYAIHRGEGIVKVVGEVGSGKTMMCRMLQLKLPDTVEIVYIANPSVSAEDILFVIAHELSLPVAREASKHEVMHMLQDYLLQRHMENKQVVLFVEEAQGMPLDTLEEIRLLSNLETDENKLLQIILFGQPELDQNLAEQSIRQLRERITHNFELEPLTRDEIHNYLNFRMRQVGYTGPELISNTVAKKVEQHSAGLLRRINIIADKILLSAFAEGTHNLSSKHVTAAVNDSSFNQEVAPPPRRSWWIGLLVLALVAAAFAFYQGRSYWMPVAASGPPVETPVAIERSNEPDVGAESETVLAVDPAGDGNSRLDTETRTDPGASAPEEVAGIPKPQTETEMVAPEPEVETPASQLDAGAEMTVAETSSPAEGSAQEPTQPVSQPENSPIVSEAEPQAEEKSLTVAALQQESIPAQQEAEDSMTIPETGATDSQEVVVAEDSAGSPETEVTDVTETPLDIEIAAAETGETDAVDDVEYDKWLEIKLRQSREWLANAEREKLSIQVMMRKKSAARELVYYLLNEWPYALTDTYLYEVNVENKVIYRVFYSEFDSVEQAHAQIALLPDNVKANVPYVHSVYLMRRDLL